MSEVYGGCIDLPDDRDFIAVNMLGDVDVDILPESFSLLNTGAKSQGNTMRCTAYGLTHVFEILNRIEHNMKIVLDANEQWGNQNGSEKYGDSLQSALNALKKNGLKDNHHRTQDGKFKIKGYAKVGHDFDEWKTWLHRGYPIYTGGIVTKTNFKNAKSTGYWTGNDGARIGGHAFCIVGWDQQKLIALNSYGKKWGFYNDGTFKIKPEAFKGTYNGYVLYDAVDPQLIFRDVSESAPYAKEIKAMLDQGIMEGYDSKTIHDPKKRFFKPDQSITRGELAVVMFNFLKRL